MSKKLDLKRPFLELIQEYPELIDIMKDIGFSEKKSTLYSKDNVMTIPKMANMKGLSMKKIAEKLKSKGFEFNAETYDANTNPLDEKPSHSTRKDMLKNYLKRLSEGESLENVRKDFVHEFGEVDASEIMEAEQELIKDGFPLAEVQQLCDVHSALFHGTTKEERIANAEKTAEKSLYGKKPETQKGIQNSGEQPDYSQKNKLAAKLSSVAGHPLETFTRENNALADLITQINSILDKNGDISGLLNKIRDLSVHYGKKGDLLYTLLKVKYGISGPSDVMWTVDDEIRHELNVLAKENDNSEIWKSRFKKVLKRAEEMIYKEQNILFPICAVNFTDDEWYEIYQDEKDYPDCFDVSSNVLDLAENTKASAAFLLDNEIAMPGGRVKLSELIALLNVIPMEITFVDAENINRFFNEGPKIFSRPKMALGREVFSCHPPKIEPMVRQIIDDFRSGRRDEVSVWMEKSGKSFLVRYMAVRDKNGKYLGTVELVQNMEFAKKHFLDE